MARKLFIVASLTALTLSACGAQTPTETAALIPTETSSATLSPTVTKTLAATESETAATTPTSSTPAANTLTPRPSAPTNPPDCTNSASFVADVTIPDNSDVPAGMLFIKTWRVRNTGTCTWGPDYTLAHYSEEQMGAVTAVPLDITRPGESVDISVELRASPSLGTHRGNFVIRNPAGLIMSVDEDSRLWVIINVTNPGTMTPTATRTFTMTPGTPSGSPTPTSTGSSSAASESSSASAACTRSTNANKLAETIEAVNAYRARNGLPPYAVNRLLTKAAQAHADDMACNNFFTHRGSDGSTPQSRVAAAGYIASSISENVYGSYPPLTGQGVVNWWINDKTDLRHNQNLLSTTFTEIGAGYSFYDNFGYYVLVFGKSQN